MASNRTNVFLHRQVAQMSVLKLSHAMCKVNKHTDLLCVFFSTNYLDGQWGSPIGVEFLLISFALGRELLENVSVKNHGNQRTKQTWLGLGNHETMEIKGTNRLGLVWFGLVWFGLVWLGHR